MEAVGETGGPDWNWRVGRRELLRWLWHWLGCTALQNRCKVGGDHAAATMEIVCFKRQVGGRSIEAAVLCSLTMRPRQGTVGFWMGKEAIFFLPSSLVAKSGLSPMRI